MCIGDFYDGHLYGLPKIHKNAMHPPLRPIVSMCGTVTHEVAQYLNKELRPFVNRNHIVGSGDELLLRLESLTLGTNQVVTSLDVESLFTNVPIEETIDIIIDTAYKHPSIPAPLIDADMMKKFLMICTTETPFKFEGRTYLQVDGVSMGSPLGPLFADFYLSHLENTLLSQEDEVTNPPFYVRYVDDILAVFNLESHIQQFIDRLQVNSVLKFTSEGMTGTTFNFLDLQLNLQSNNKFTTSVYIKPTDKGLYTNFKSPTPEVYKKSVVKTLIHRAIRYSGSWKELDAEIVRLKQIFVNNNYPLTIVDSIVNRLLSKFIEKSTQEPLNSIDYFIRLDNLPNFENDTKEIRKIIDTHVKPVDPSYSIIVRTYFSAPKLSSVFSTREKKRPEDRVSVVYQFNCTEDQCNLAYIGYTTNTLATRCKQHRYSPSSIQQHYSKDHHKKPPPYENLIKNFRIINSYHNKLDLKISEALSIKANNPFINVKYNEMSSILKLFK